MNVPVAVPHSPRELTEREISALDMRIFKSARSTWSVYRLSALR